MVVSARDMRRRAGEILRAVQNGQSVTVTLRGREIAEIRPIGMAKDRPFRPIAFGAWKRNPRVRDVRRFLDSLREPRRKR